jgi:hypothetical protein
MQAYRERTFTDASIAETLAFLGLAHPRGGAKSKWSALPDHLLREIATWILEPLCNTFASLPSPALMPAGILLFDNRALRVKLRRDDIMAHSEYVALCGPQMLPDSGIYDIQFLVTDIAAVDTFCRADIGIAIDEENPHRVGSGVRWEAGDGDIFVAADAGGVGGNGHPGWLCDAGRVDEGVLPRWDEDGRKPGLVVDTYQRRLGFTMNGVTLPFELPLPSSVKFRFVVSWTSGTKGIYTIQKMRRRVLDTLPTDIAEGLEKEPSKSFKNTVTDEHWSCVATASNASVASQHDPRSRNSYIRVHKPTLSGGAPVRISVIMAVLVSAALVHRFCPMFGSLNS